MSLILRVLSLFGLFLAIVLKSNPSRVTLPSLYQHPSELYSPDFYDGGNDLILPMGRMRYWEFGPTDGKKVLLIHGISTGASTYDKVGRILAENNHRVLVFDLWGRGYSDAPAMHYDDSLYVTQVALLLQKVGWNKMDVVGVSLGGGIASSFTAFYPEMVNKLVLIAPAGLMEPNDMPWTGKLARHSFMRHIVSLPFVRPLALVAIKNFYKSVRRDPLNEESQKIASIALYQFEHHPGFLRAFLYTVSDFPFYGLHDRYETVGQYCRNSSLQVLALWGDADKTVPFENVKLLKRYIPEATIEVYPGGGHDIIITQANKIASDILQFLQ
ncbi:Alpha/Beta hydrolase protein [Halteromyces radiatus]|uniref:Alpha/Beta hydrolase protein n=1 Tax=Halteromyces radiatus TaxID=101107 RepID=UPI002220FC94|nr:Alpha/Beta hydrolase protein [Halteromyces radiatus]KAI8088991.1 Alpha/Beta hydrolase protein [Halteromyces radiatus]